MIENESINRAISYILDHINEPISVEEISNYCNFSKYYFSRLFKAETGESIYEFIKRVKIEQSALRLKIQKKKKITDISCDYGYSSSNYSSAFKQHYNISPIKFRRSILQKSLQNPIFHNTASHLESFELCERKISIKQLPDYFVAYDRHKGSYKNLSLHWGEFLEKYKKYITEETLLIECTYDDPIITDIDGCLYDLCITIPDNCQLKHTCVLKGGKFAVYHFEDFADQIYHSIQSIFNVWLPQSGYELDERYGFDIYRKVDCDTMIMEIDLCIPIK